MSEIPTKRICVILGAGASHDVWARETIILDEGLKPPLASQLFDLDKHPGYSVYLNDYPGARALAPGLAGPEFADQGSLEAALTHYAHHSNQELKEHYKHVPPYLRDLLWASSTGYVRDPNCYIHLARELLLETPNHVLFLVLNYDTLLEQALKRVRPTLTYDALDSYVESGRGAQVVKLHGSVNWFAIIPDFAGNWLSAVSSFDLEDLRSAEWWISDRVRQVHSHSRENRSLYPVITAPLADKNVSELVCPPEHTAFAKTFLQECYKFLIIGSSGMDQDLLSLLDESINPKADLYIHIVDNGFTALDSARDQFEGGVRAFGVMMRSDTAGQFTDGFQSYVRSQALKTIARYVP